MEESVRSLPASFTETDPEFVAYVGSLVAEQVVTHAGALPGHTRHLMQLGALIATGAQAQYRALLDTALSAGVTPVQAKEVVYHAVPYVGLGRALDALDITNEVLNERGVELPLPGQSTTAPGDRFSRGRAVQEQVVTPEAVAAMYAGAAADEMHLPELVTANCFGDNYTRTGLDLPVRELLTFALLAPLGGAEPQVRGHVAANLNMGSGRATLIAVLTVLVPYIGYPRTLNALRVVDEVAPPKPTTPEGS